MQNLITGTLTLKEIFRYGECTVTSRNYEEGEKVIAAGHIVLIGRRPLISEFYHIYALVLQTSCLSGVPHVIEGTITKKGLGIKSFQCCCKAGSQKCKHIIAVLLHCNRNSIEKLEEISSTDIKCLWSQKKNVAEDLYKPEPVYSFCCARPRKILFQEKNKDDKEEKQDKRDEEENRDKCNEENKKDKCNEGNKNEKWNEENKKEKSNKKNKNNKSNKEKKKDKEKQKVFSLDPKEYDDLLSAMRNTFLEAAPLSALARHYKMIDKNSFVEYDGYGISNVDEKNIAVAKKVCQDNDLMQRLAETAVVDLKDCCRKIYAEKILPDDVVQICATTMTDKTLWSMERQYRITGSRCYSLYTAFRNEKTDWAKKSKNYFWPKIFSNEAMQHGIKTEDEARQAYILETGAEVERPGLVVSQMNPWLAYSPDEVAMENGKPKKLLEIKCPQLGVTKNISEVIGTLPYLQKVGNDYVLRKKHPYFGQITHGMAVLGVQECDFFIYCPAKDPIPSYAVATIKIDNAFASDMLLTLKTVYFENMLHNLCLFFN